MIHIDKVIIVEGKYDKIRLENIVDAKIMTTGGFDIYGDAAKRKLLQKLAQKHGIIILTDSDRAGYKIRSHIYGFLPKENVTQLYIPQRDGKESRKDKPSKDGFLGVEGIDNETLAKLFEPFESGKEEKLPEFTKTDLYEFGLMGCADSAMLRDKLCVALDLPCKMSSNALLGALNAIYTKNEIIDELRKIKNEQNQDRH